MLSPLYLDSEEIKRDTKRMKEFVQLSQTLIIYCHDTLDLPTSDKLLDIFGKVGNSYSDMETHDDDDIIFLSIFSRDIVITVYHHISSNRLNLQLIIHIMLLLLNIYQVVIFNNCYRHCSCCQQNDNNTMMWPSIIVHISDNV